MQDSQTWKWHKCLRLILEHNANSVRTSLFSYTKPYFILLSWWICKVSTYCKTRKTHSMYHTAHAQDFTFWPYLLLLTSQSCSSFSSKNWYHFWMQGNQREAANSKKHTHLPEICTYYRLPAELLKMHLRWNSRKNIQKRFRSFRNKNSA